MRGAGASKAPGVPTEGTCILVSGDITTNWTAKKDVAHTQHHLRPESVKQITKELSAQQFLDFFNEKVAASVNQLLVVTLRRRCLVLK